MTYDLKKALEANQLEQYFIQRHHWDREHQQWEEERQRWKREDRWWIFEKVMLGIIALSATIGLILHYFGSVVR